MGVFGNLLLPLRQKEAEEPNRTSKGRYTIIRLVIIEPQLILTETAGEIFGRIKLSFKSDVLRKYRADDDVRYIRPRESRCSVGKLSKLQGKFIFKDLIVVSTSKRRLAGWMHQNHILFTMSKPFIYKLFYRFCGCVSL